jgi:hypothetical protein
MGTHLYPQTNKTTPHVLKSYSGGQTAIVPRQKRVAKTKEQLREKEATAILGRVEKLLGIKVSGHKLIYNHEENKYGIWLKYVGQKNDPVEKQMEFVMKLVENVGEALKGSKIFNLVFIA